MRTRLALVAISFAAVAALAQDSPTPQVAEGFAHPRVDFGIVVSDIEASKAFYGEALGLTQSREFTVSGEFAAAFGLTDSLPFTVHVMQAGSGPSATEVKLMEFAGTRPSRPDNSFIHSTYGVRYLTFYVDDLGAALRRAAARNVKPLGRGPQRIPEDVAPGGIGIALVRDPDGNAVELVGPMSK
jgi:catechol 2,3-dioxygenase-like lactoylglutathione lyase family enzyme